MSIASLNKSRRLREDLFSKKFGDYKKRVDSGCQVKDLDFSFFEDKESYFRDLMMRYIESHKKRGFDI